MRRCFRPCSIMLVCGISVVSCFSLKTVPAGDSSVAYLKKSNKHLCYPLAGCRHVQNRTLEGRLHRHRGRVEPVRLVDLAEYARLSLRLFLVAIGKAHTASTGRTGIDAETSSTGGGIEMEPPPNSLQSSLEDGLDLLGQSTKWVVAGSVGTALVVRADADTLVWVVGSLLNVVFSKALKKAINQVRPDGSQRKDPGMPSSHAMSLFFLGTYLVIALQQHGVTDSGVPCWPFGALETQALIVLYAVAASVWRVKVRFHTLPQVSVGAAVGSVDAALWYYLGQVYLTPQVDELLGGTDVPIGMSLSISVVTLFAFGNVPRGIQEMLREAQEDNIDAKTL